MNNYKHEFVNDWAQWFAVDGSGKGWEYEDKPFFNGLHWASVTGRDSKEANFPAPQANPQDSLQSRYTEQHANCWQNLNTLAKPECTGEGLPKVGVECEFSSVGHHEGFAWGKYHGKLVNDEGLIIEFRSSSNPDATIVTSFNPDVTEFRPAQTDKQRVIEKAKTVVNGGQEFDSRELERFVHRVIDQLSDAGMLTEPKGEEL